MASAKKTTMSKPAPKGKQMDLELFEIFEKPDSDQRLSHTLELYDALPKYNWSNRELTDLNESEITRTATVRGKEYKVVIRPAIIKKKMIFPGEREELVEDALRKFATSGQGKMLESNAGVAFSLSQLKTELQSMGHGFDLNEIKEAISVCKGCNLEVYGDDGETLLSSAIFPIIGLTTRAAYLSKSDALCYVAFNPLVTKAIQTLNFRQYDYLKGMTMSSPLARFIYKRMSHYWVQASLSNPYTPSLVSFLSQSPRGLSEDMYSNTRAMNNALNLLIKTRVVSNFDERVIKNGRKIVDVDYTIWPHDEFIKMAKAANFHSKKIRDLAEIQVVKGALKGPARKPVAEPQ